MKNTGNGFTLVESLIVLLILGIGALALAQAMAVGVSMNVRTKDDTELTTIATKYLENLYQASYRNLTVGGDIHPAPGTEDPSFCALNFQPESDIPNSDTLHKSAATYDVYWQVRDGTGTVAGAPFKVITVRVVSKRLQVQTLGACEITVSLQVINQFAT